jgi:hypothetical protein
MSAFYQSAFVFSPGFAWPLHQSLLCSSGFWERSSRCGDSQAGFLPENCLNGETHKVQRDFLFCSPKAQAPIDYRKHTHTHAKTKTHTHTKQDVLSPLLEPSAILPSVSLSPTAQDFTIMVIKPLSLIGDVTES